MSADTLTAPALPRRGTPQVDRALSRRALTKAEATQKDLKVFVPLGLLRSCYFRRRKLMGVASVPLRPPHARSS
jgi:hypothetical protein